MGTRSCPPVGSMGNWKNKRFTKLIGPKAITEKTRHVRPGGSTSSSVRCTCSPIDRMGWTLATWWFQTRSLVRSTRQLGFPSSQLHSPARQSWQRRRGRIPQTLLQKKWEWLPLGRRRLRRVRKSPRNKSILQRKNCLAEVILLAPLTKIHQALWRHRALQTHWRVARRRHRALQTHW